MKKLILTTAALLLSVSSQASMPVQRLYQSNLTQVQLDPALQQTIRGIQTVKSGTLMVDLAKREVTLTLVRQSVCPPGRACAAVMPPPVVIQLPITEQYLDDQGNKVIVATDRPSDPNAFSLTRTLTITDVRPNVRFVATIVEMDYEFMDPNNVDVILKKVITHSKMFGTRLTRFDLE